MSPTHGVFAVESLEAPILGELAAAAEITVLRGLAHYSDGTEEAYRAWLQGRGLPPAPQLTAPLPPSARRVEWLRQVADPTAPYAQFEEQALWPALAELGHTVRTAAVSRPCELGHDVWVFRGAPGGDKVVHPLYRDGFFTFAVISGDPLHLQAGEERLARVRAASRRVPPRPAPAGVPVSA